MREKVKTLIIWDLKKDLNKLHRLKNSVLCIGNFDGLHKGHNRVLQEGYDMSKRFERPLVAISFLPHPRLLLRPQNFFILTPVSAKILELTKLGADYLVMFNFPSIMNIEYKEFCEFIEVHFNPCGICVGFDFSFGKEALGTAEDIKKFFSKIEVKIVGKISVNSDQKISSSFLRKTIREGSVDKYQKYTGKFYSVRGCVVKGEGRGTKIGFPTANISTTYFLPPDGVYACFVKLLDQGNQTALKAVCNIGPQPTFNSNKKTLEVFIIGFEGNIYLKSIEIMFVKRIRDVMKFQNPEELKKRIQEDIEEAKSILASW